VVEGDSSQIEARTNSWNAEQDDLIRVWDNERSEMLFLLTMGASAEEFAALKRKYDVYRDFAADWIYHIPRDQVTPEMRMVAKSAVLGCGYMMGVERFREYVRIETGLHLDIGQAQAVIYAYRTRMNRIAGFWDVCKTVLAGMVHGEEFNFGRNGWLKSDPHDKTIRLPSGRFLFYRGLHVIAADEDREYESFAYTRKQGRGGERKVYIHPGLLTENIIQAIARDVVLWQMALIAKKYEVVTSAYDSVAYLAPVREREEAIEYGRQCMLRVPSWLFGFPINCEMGAGASYGEA